MRIFNSLNVGTSGRAHLRLQLHNGEFNQLFWHRLLLG
jgi:hypothetical protein